MLPTSSIQAIRRTSASTGKSTVRPATSVPAGGVRKRRAPIQALFALGFLGLSAATARSWQEDGWVAWTMECAGVGSLFLGVLGRLTAGIYNRGHHGKILLELGPYSVVRHPLYLCNAAISLGFGLASQRLTLAALLFVTFALYQWRLMVAEERLLLRRFGESFRDYQRRVPMLVPRLSLHREPESWDIKPAKWRRTLIHTILILTLFLGFEALQRIQLEGSLPTLLSIP